MGIAIGGLSSIIVGRRVRQQSVARSDQSLNIPVQYFAINSLARPARRRQPRLLRWMTAQFVVFSLLAGLLTARSADAPTGAFKTIDRTNFSLKYPSDWTEDTKAPDYKADSNFTLKSPDPKNTYVQFNIVDKSEDPDKVLKATLVSLDGPAITALSKSKITTWGQHQGAGMHLKGKILDSIPGGIKVFIFNSGNHNILVVEYYFSEELKDLQADLDFISNNFVMKN
jgi:hypothetical protein